MSDTMNVEKVKFSLRKNDQVQVIAGREKGKTGKILKVDSKSGRVTVEKTNMVKRHTKASASQGGGIIEKELPLHYSNVLLLCPKCNRGVRHAHKQAEKSEGTQRKKIRVCKRCGEKLDLA
jgi:large subunit ribosomal protein L24